MRVDNIKLFTLLRKGWYHISHQNLFSYETLCCCVVLCHKSQLMRTDALFCNAERGSRVVFGVFITKRFSWMCLCVVISFH